MPFNDSDSLSNARAYSRALIFDHTRFELCRARKKTHSVAVKRSGRCDVDQVLSHAQEHSARGVGGAGEDPGGAEDSLRIQSASAAAAAFGD